MNSILQKQLALDYCCRQEDISSGGNRFTVFRRLNGQRRFDDNAVTDDIVTDGIVTDGGECFLKIAAVNGKLLFCGSETIIPKLESRFRNASGAWFMEAGNLMELQELLGEFGYRIKQFHPFYIADKKQSPLHRMAMPRYSTRYSIRKPKYLGSGVTAGSAKPLPSTKMRPMCSAWRLFAAAK